MKPSLIIVTIALSFSVFGYANANVQDEISERQRQIEEIEREIAGLQQQIVETQGEARTLENEVNIFNSQIRQIELGIRALELSIGETVLEIQMTEDRILDAEEKINKHKEAIARFIRLNYEFDQVTLTHILLANDNLSDFFDAFNQIRTNQEKLTAVMPQIKQLRTELGEYQDALEGRRIELDQARQLEAIERQSLSQSRTSVDKLLKDTRGQEARFQEMVQQSQRNIEAIRAQIQFLVQSGLTAEDAVRYAQLAAIGTGIRPAFLLALLEYETGLGRNVGKCNIVDTTSGTSRHVTTGALSAPGRGIHPTRDLPVLINITAELGMNPLETPISCWPGYGYGGAMGPAQFIPSTWMGYREEVSRITGRTPANPWHFEDAFTASAIYLARRGAATQTRASEIAAAKAYISGNPNCSSVACNRYANGIQNIAAEIEKNL